MVTTSNGMNATILRCIVEGFLAGMGLEVVSTLFQHYFGGLDHGGDFVADL